MFDPTTTELTVAELDGLLAEQLPARELMTNSSCGCGGYSDHTEQSNSNHSFITVVNWQQNADDGGQAGLVNLN